MVDWPEKDSSEFQWRIRAVFENQQGDEWEERNGQNWNPDYSDYKPKGPMARKNGRWTRPFLAGISGLVLMGKSLSVLTKAYMKESDFQYPVLCKKLYQIFHRRVRKRVLHLLPTAKSRDVCLSHLGIPSKIIWRRLGGFLLNASSIRLMHHNRDVTRCGRRNASMWSLWCFVNRVSRFWCKHCSFRISAHLT